ncbi:MAG TPA: argininosuccinate lyase [Spirochaetota bacterium]|nr:argininosuccinate lyase [Spirochaetota bacterium]
MKNKKLWGGRFDGTPSKITERISASIQYDARLYRQDIAGSMAHARMLHRMGVLSGEELGAIIGGLEGIRADIDSGRFEFSASLEDIHMNIESALTERIGDAGRKLHTARSRNDQVALDLRLYIRDEGDDIALLLRELISLLSDLAARHIDVIMPGFTHLQVAQPVRFSQHMLAHAWALLRDLERLRHAVLSSSSLPLGVGACAGVNYENDREFLRNELGFGSVTPNSMDTVSDRDFALDFLYFAAVLGMHLSRFAEELVLWSATAFGFVRLADSVTTGSSIMPQKRNPDIAELVRGKSGRLYGNLVSLLTTMKGLPLTYNRDMQEDKEPLFDSVDTVKLCLEGMKEMLATIEVKEEVMMKAVSSGFSTATDLADYLVKKGVPFRKSHEIVGGIVKHCESTGADFFALTLDQLKKFSDAFDADVLESISPVSSTERKASRGSTSRKEVIGQIGDIRAALEKIFPEKR